MIALVASEASRPPTPARLGALLTATLGESASVRETPHGTLELRVGDEEVVVAPSDDPIAWSVLEEPCEAAWYWPEAPQVLRQHRTHVAIILKDAGAGDARLKSMLLTRLANLVADAADCCAVYWEPAAMVHSAQAFAESAASMTVDRLPLRIWVRFQLVPNDDGTHSLCTQGLEPLGFWELEVRQSRRPAPNVLGWAFNVAHFLLDRGALIGDGETVGVSPQEWIRVHHLPSAVDPARSVLYLDLDLDEELQAGQA